MKSIPLIVKGGWLYQTSAAVLFIITLAAAILLAEDKGNMQSAKSHPLTAYAGTWKTHLTVNNMSLVIHVENDMIAGELEAFTPNAEHITDAEFSCRLGSDQKCIFSGKQTVQQERLLWP